MNDETRSKELLLGSYQLSVHRIEEALSGGLEIQNSRKPQAPPWSTDHIVGLCGQGGRHPYFRIPVRVLKSAMTSIMQAGERSHSPERALDRVSSICQDLRRKTIFDTSTGCVNDEIPAMVPLLPPEEIWYNGRQLPLDIWRLISFEFDLVSSALAAQTPISDISYSSLTSGALTFAYMMNQLGQHRVSFALMDEAMPLDLSQQLNCSRQLKIPLSRVFFEAGCLLTPLADQEFVRWYPALRYLHWLSKKDGELRVREEFRDKSVDSRYKGLFAEEMAIGLMSVILGERLGTIRINNTVEVLPTSYPSGEPIADFIAYSINPDNGKPRMIVSESKGSLGRRVSASRRQRAKDQVQRTNLAFPHTTEKVSLTFCSTIYFSKQNPHTHCIVTDPPSQREHEPIVLDPVNAWRVAYAKALRFVGLEVASRQVLRGEPAESLRRVEWEREADRREDELYRIRVRREGLARERYGADLVLDMGNWAVSMDSSVLGVLTRGIHGESQYELARRLESRLSRELEPPERREGESSFLTSLGIGCVFNSDLGL